MRDSTIRALRAPVDAANHGTDTVADRVASARTVPSAATATRCAKLDGDVAASKRFTVPLTPTRWLYSA